MAGNFSVRFVLDRKCLRRLAPPNQPDIGQLSHAEHRNKSLGELRYYAILSIPTIPSKMRSCALHLDAAARSVLSPSVAISPRAL